MSVDDDHWRIDPASPDDRVWAGEATRTGAGRTYHVGGDQPLCGCDQGTLQAVPRRALPDSTTLCRRCLRAQTGDSRQLASLLASADPDAVGQPLDRVGGQSAGGIDR